MAVQKPHTQAFPTSVFFLRVRGRPGYDARVLVCHVYMYQFLLYCRSLAQDDTIVGVALGYALDTRRKEQHPCVRVVMKASTRGLDVSAAESDDKMEDLKKRVSEEVTKCMNKSEKRRYSAEDYESWLKFTDHDPNKYKCTELYS